MRYLSIILILFAFLSTSAQSGRTGEGISAKAASAAGDISVKDMFTEANGYVRTKVDEFEANKVRFSEKLLADTQRQQRQLAARHAAAAGMRKDLAGDDLYYLGMLHWIAENMEGTADNLQKFIADPGSAVDRRQTARSIAIVALAKLKRTGEAENILADYLKAEPTKLTEKARIGGELAKAYQAAREFKRMAPHAETAYEASKALLKEASSRARGLDEILDAGMLVYEAFRDSGEQKRADDALEDMRKTAASVQSPSFYYYAVDQKIKYMIETGRKAEALEFYTSALANVGKELTLKSASDNVVSRLRKRDRHYKLLGETAPEMPAVDKWFPGSPRTFAQMKGKVILIDFWATWCGPCFEAFPHLIEWQQEFGADGFEILGVTRYYGEGGAMPAERPAEIEALKQFRQKEKLPYDFVVASDQSIQLLYGGTALPTAVLVDRKGVIRYIESGTSPTRMLQMREMILKLIAEK